MIKVEKRDGSVVDFDTKKIASAISKAFDSLHLKKDDSIIEMLVLRATADFQNKIKKDIVSVETIQDSVEKTLSESGYYVVAKAYILYRKQRENVRQIQNSANDYMNLMNSYLSNDSDKEDENSMSTFSVGGLILSNSGKITSNYWLSEIYDSEITNAHKNGDMYIHNLDMLTGSNAGWSLLSIIKEGIVSVNGSVASLPAKHLSTLCNQIVNFLGIMQNEWASAQSLCHFDTFLSPYVLKENLSRKQVYDCLESFVYGVNIPSRWGTQAPFSQITLDLSVPEQYKNVKCYVGDIEQDFTYDQCQEAMDLIQDCLMEIFEKGDQLKRGFIFPIIGVYLHSNMEYKRYEKLFKVTSKYGTPYFLKKKNKDIDGYFGYDENKGSIGTVSLNLVRLAYLSENKTDFFKRLDSLLNCAIRSLKVKRQVLNQFLEVGLFPYSGKHLKNFNDHYGIIGIIGMNETCLNARWVKKDLMNLESIDFCKEILVYIQNYLDTQKDKLLMEAIPAESICTRFAKLDKEKYPEIQSFGYYTNSSHFDVNSCDDIFQVLEIQQQLQVLYSGATCMPIFIDHKIESSEMAYRYVNMIYENYDLPCFNITPTYSICLKDGYIRGSKSICPICGEKAQIYSRISGYYKALDDWNEGKKIEFSRRKMYTI